MVNEVERRLLALIACLDCRHAVFDSPPQYHYTPRTTPACQPEFAYHRVKALPCILPVALLPLPLDQTLNSGSLP